jgi:Peptidase family S41
MSESRLPISASELSTLWALVTFMHPRGGGAAWTEAFDALLDQAGTGDDWPEHDAVGAALEALGDPLTCISRLDHVPQGMVCGDALEADGEMVLRAADYSGFEYDLSLGSVLREKLRPLTPKDVLIDLRGASWWFLRQVGQALADALGERLEFPPEHARIVSGPVLGVLDQSGAPWSGHVRRDRDVIEPAGSASARHVTLMMTGHGSLAGQLVTAAERAGAQVLRVDEQDVPYGNAVTMHVGERCLARIRTSWIDDAAMANVTLAAERPGPSSLTETSKPRVARPPASTAGLLKGIVKFGGYLRYFYPYADERLSDGLRQAESEAAQLVVGRHPDIEQSFVRILKKLRDSHARVYSRDQDQFFGSSLERSPFLLRDDRAVVLREGHGLLARFEPGTQLLAVNDSPIRDRVDHLLTTASHSSDRAAAWMVERYLFRLHGQHSKLLLARADGTQETVRLSCAQIREGEAPSVSAVAGNVVLIDMTRLEQANVADAARAAGSAAGLILDLRGYVGTGSWQLARRLAWRQGRVAVFERRELRGVGPSVTARTTHEARVSRHPDARRIPMVALIDHRTISRSEYLALMLRAGTNCLWLGTNSAGCVGDVANFKVSAEVSIAFSGQKTLTPSGDEIQGLGLAPDIRLDQFRDGIPLSRNEWVERARKVIENQRGAFDEIDEDD